MKFYKDLPINTLVQCCCHICPFNFAVTLNELQISCLSDMLKISQLPKRVKTMTSFHAVFKKQCLWERAEIVSQQSASQLSQ